MASTTECLASDCPNAISGVTCELSISNVDKTDDIVLYPLPFEDYLNIQIQQPILQLDVLDASGRLIKSATGAFTKYHFDTLASGMYYLRISTKNNIYLKKAIKK